MPKRSRQRRWVEQTARRLGYTVELRGGTHFQCRHPETGAVVHVCDGGDHRCMKNTEATLRRHAERRKS